MGRWEMEVKAHSRGLPRLQGHQHPPQHGGLRAAAAFRFHRPSEPSRSVPNKQAALGTASQF